MNQSSSTPILMKFCPFCGGNLEKSASQKFKFCPFCGKPLQLSGIEPPITTEMPITPLSPNVTASVDYTPYEQVSCMDDVIKNGERFIQDRLREGLPENEIRPLAAELMMHLKSKIPAKIKHSPVTPALKADSLQMSSFYSIVLKNCSRRENLARRLGTVLLRGYFAIRLAIDNMPCIIVYKGKCSELPSLISLFREEGAAITVIAGDFEARITIPQIFSSLHLSDEMLLFLNHFPHQLWLGDHPYAAVFAQSMDRDGILVVTDQAFYFVYRPGNSCEWFILPHNPKQNTSLLIDSETHTLQILEENQAQTPVLMMKVSFPGEDEMNQVVQAWEKAKKDQHFIIHLHSRCPHCGYSQQICVDSAELDDSCPKCQEKMDRQILQKRI